MRRSLAAVAALALLSTLLAAPAAGQRPRNCREQECSDKWSDRIDAALRGAADQLNRATTLLTLSEGQQEGAFDAGIAANAEPLRTAEAGNRRRCCGGWGRSAPLLASTGVVIPPPSPLDTHTLSPGAPPDCCPALCRRCAVQALMLQSQASM